MKRSAKFRYFRCDETFFVVSMLSIVGALQIMSHDMPGRPRAATQQRVSKSPVNEGLKLAHPRQFRAAERPGSLRSG